MRLSALAALAALFGAAGLGAAEPVPVIPTPVSHEAYWLQEAEQFGYAPGFDPQVVGFDAANRPYLRSGSQVLTLDAAGNWVGSDFAAAIRAACPAWDGNFRQGDFSESHVVFDDTDTATIVVNASRSNLHQVFLLTSTDYCRTWRVTPVPGNGGYRTFTLLEHRDGHNRLPGLPPLLVGVPPPGADAEAAPCFGIDLYLPQRLPDGSVDVGQPLHVTDDGFVIPIHSGAGNMLFSTPGKTHVFWAAATPVPGHETAGTATYGRTFDHATRSLGPVVFLGYGGSGKPDNHNLPAVTADSQGYLHLLLGAHHDRFAYRRSLQPGALDAWTEPELVGRPRVASGGSYTYVGLVCDSRDNLHCLARWAGDAYFFRLAYLRKPAGKPWEPHRVLVSPFRGMYGCWYHKLTIDRHDKLYCNYVSFSGQLSNGEAAAFSYKFPALANSWAQGYGALRSRALLASSDGGNEWHLGVTADFQPGTALAPAPPPAAPPPLPAPRFVAPLAQLGGAVGALAAWGPETAAAIGNRLVLFTFAADGQPQVAAQSPLLPDPVRGLAATERHLCAATARKLLVYERDPVRGLREVASLALGSFGGRLALIGDVLFVLNGDSGALAFRIAADGKPTALGRIGKLPAFDLAVIDRTAYVAAGNQGLALWDLANPAKPLPTKVLPYVQTDRATGTWAVAAVSGYPVLGAAPSSDVPLRVLDPANPSRELYRQHEGTWAWGRKVAANGKLAYYPGPGFIAVLDFSNPAAPKTLAQLPAPGNVQQLLLQDQRLLASAGTDGLLVFDCRDPAAPRLLQHYAEPVCPWGLAVAEGRAVLADWAAGVATLNLATAAQPAPLGLLAKPPAPKPLPYTPPPNYPSRFRAVLLGQTALVPAGPEGLLIVDLRDPARPALAGTWKSEHPLRDLAASGTLGYAAEAGLGLRLLDLGTPSQPRPLGTLANPREVLAVAAQGDLLALGEAIVARRGDLRLFTGAAAGRPVPAGSLALPVEVYGLAFAPDGLLYLALANRGLGIVDVRDPAQPRLLGTVRTTGEPWGLAVNGELLYAAAGPAGLLTLDRRALLP